MAFCCILSKNIRCRKLHFNVKPVSSDALPIALQMILSKVCMFMALSIAIVCTVYLLKYIYDTGLFKNHSIQFQYNTDTFPVSTYDLQNTLKWNGENSFQLQRSVSYRKEVFATYFRPFINAAGINCTKIISNNQAEISKAKTIMEKTNYTHTGKTPDFYLNRTLNCQKFRNLRGYIDHPLSNIELQFPLAFAILTFRDIEQFERLFRSIYRPHNFYCLHLDYKTNEYERSAFESIVNCFSNLHITNISIDVRWGTFSVLDAELMCMKTLWQYNKWKYYINLTGQEFPLKTNRDIVSILKNVRSANIVQGIYIRKSNVNYMRWTRAQMPPPHNINLFKGSVHIAANRHFVDFALHDNRSRDFLNWLKHTQIPDETFFATLNHNPHLGIIGSFLGGIENKPRQPFFLRYVSWNPHTPGKVTNCYGKYVRDVCVFGIGDLYQAYNDIGLFANKFYLDFEPLALDCLEEVLYDKTWKQYVEDISTDLSHYTNLNYAKMTLRAS